MKRESVPGAGFGEQAGIVLFGQWSIFCDLRERVLDTGDIDAIHDLRVASRRIRAMLGLFRPYISAKKANKGAKEFRRVTRELGRLRNIDEALIYFRGSPEPLPVLMRLLPAAREEEMQAVTDLLESFPRDRVDRLMRSAVAELGRVADDDRQVPAYLSETSSRRYQALSGLLVPATVPGDAAARHALRIAVKKWRYLLETLGQVCRADNSATLAALKEYQTVLGRLNDLVEFGELCAAFELPPQERETIAAALSRDSAACLERFIATAASRPLQYSVTRRGTRT